MAGSKKRGLPDEDDFQAKRPSPVLVSNSNGDNLPALASQNARSAPSSSQDTDIYERQVLDLTQEEEAAKELYGTFDTKVVGVQYYRGHASTGEAILCLRDSDNQYDKNAVRIDNVMGQQIGHLPRKVVAKIAPYLDYGDLTLEGQLTGPKAQYDCPIVLYLYGPSNPTERRRIEKKLREDKLLKAAQLNKTRKESEAQRATMGLKAGRTTYGMGSTGFDEPEISLEEILKKAQPVEFRNGADAIRTFAMDEEYLSKMPSSDQPTALRATLLPYQLQGLAWMSSKENPVLPTKELGTQVQLWKQDNRGYYWNVATDFVSTAAPRLFSGGILADDMGLGKTIQMISLILTGGTGTTLIVAPVGVMTTWKQQVERHVKLAREKDTNVPQVLLSQSIEWRRVVLDEGHIIRNARTKVALAACAINARSRWVLTGTPIINSLRDFQSLIKFLHITGGIEHPEIFHMRVTRNLASGDAGAEIILQALMQDICLRRNKDMKFVDLKIPKKTEYLHRITFHPEEKIKYEALLAEARGALAAYQAKAAGGKGQFQGVLERLLRLRQLCNHWTLCKDRISQLMRLFEGQDVVPFNEKNTALLQEALRLYLESQENCAICFEIPTGPVITNCKHVFCRACISRAIQLQHRCPMCRNELSEECLLEPAIEGSFDEKFDIATQSSKTEAMLHILRATLKNHGSKIVIFSQWTSFLNIIQNQLEDAGIKYSRIDGSMSTGKRDNAVRVLDNDAETRVMLASLAVCSVGLNLVSADTVILSDSWWAPAIEDQAVDRVHRLGQTRKTTVWRLIVEGSVEERVLNIQKEKRDLVTKAFQEKERKGKSAKDTRMADIVTLLS
ncbi:hypothetical protein ED733_007127 [Metarhizium rileyi]|uniref:SNF2-related protein n=1 Tax=Metarhizium rileyi (strain RCEF 4871) TaxID=1649241 RepID=A0A5C6GEW4_METRR|nr:hypothetical protein ED733_007127 [Metarhizium rileyi]